MQYYYIADWIVEQLDALSGITWCNCVQFVTLVTAALLYCGTLSSVCEIAVSAHYLQKADCEHFAFEIHAQSKTRVNWLFLFSGKVKMASLL